MPVEIGPRHALFLARDDEHRQHRDDGAVHGHRHAHLAERYAVEQDLHVLDRIDRHARLADIAGDPRMIGIIAPVGGQIEGHRQALLPGGEVLAVKCVGFLRRREAGILADGPGLPGIHGRAHAAGEGGEARKVGGHALGQVVRGVERLQRDALRRFGVEALDRPALEVLRGKLEPVAGGLGHCADPCEPVLIQKSPPQPLPTRGRGLPGRPCSGSPPACRGADLSVEVKKVRLVPSPSPLWRGVGEGCFNVSKPFTSRTP